MAKINEDMVVIKVSELLKDSDSESPIMDEEFVGTLEGVVQELLYFFPANRTLRIRLAQ